MQKQIVFVVLRTLLRSWVTNVICHQLAEGGGGGVGDFVCRCVPGQFLCLCHTC